MGLWRWLQSRCTMYTIGLCKALSNTLLFSNRDAYSSFTYFPLLANISRSGQGHMTNKAPSFCQLASGCTLGSVTSLDSEHPKACSHAFVAGFTQKLGSHCQLLNKACYGKHGRAFLQDWLSAGSWALKQPPCNTLTLSLPVF